VDEAVSEAPGDVTIASALAPVSGADATVPSAPAATAIIAEGELATASDHAKTEEVQATLAPHEADSPLPAYTSRAIPAPQPSGLAPTVTPEAPSGRYRIDTMRVEP
jgi:hypothetical protein